MIGETGGFVYWSSHRFEAGKTMDVQPKLFTTARGNPGNGYQVNSIAQTNVMVAGDERFSDEPGAALWPVGQFRIERVMWDVTSDDEEARERVWRSSAWAFESPTVIWDLCPLTMFDVADLLGTPDRRAAELEERLRLLWRERSSRTLTGLRVLRPHFLARNPFAMRLQVWTPADGAADSEPWRPKADVHVRITIVGHDGAAVGVSPPA